MLYSNYTPQKNFVNKFISFRDYINVHVFCSETMRSMNRHHTVKSLILMYSGITFYGQLADHHYFYLKINLVLLPWLCIYTGFQPQNESVFPFSVAHMWRIVGTHYVETFYAWCSAECARIRFTCDNSSRRGTNLAWLYSSDTCSTCTFKSSNG